MASIKLFDQTGKEVSSVELNDIIFGVEPNESVVFDVVISQRVSLHQGTHAAKNRLAVSSGGCRPQCQKGVGRARQGSICSSQRHGGGVVFGPASCLHGYKLPQKVHRFALKSVCSVKAAKGKFVTVEGLSFTASKTVEFANVLSALNVDSRVLVILEEGNKFAALFACNLPNVKVATATITSVLDIVNSDKPLVTKEAISTVEEVFAQ